MSRSQNRRMQELLDQQAKYLDLDRLRRDTGESASSPEWYMAVHLFGIDGAPRHTVRKIAECIRVSHQGGINIRDSILRKYAPDLPEDLRPKIKVRKKKAKS